MKRKRISEEFYKGLEPYALSKLIKTYIKRKNYEDFQVALNAVRGSEDKINILHIMYLAIDYLNHEIINTILINTEIGKKHLNSSLDCAITYTSNIGYGSLPCAKRQNISPKEINNIKSEIIKDLVSLKIKNINEVNKTHEKKIKLDQNSIETLFQYLTAAEAQQFIKDNEINIAEFQNSTLCFLSCKDSMQIRVPAKCSAKDILLARTYTIDTSIREIISEAYEKLLSWPETQKILHFIVAQIVKGDSIKVIFSDLDSQYDFNQNLIYIEINPEENYTRESTMAHEFSHFLMEKLYNNECCPFPIPLYLKSLVFEKEYVACSDSDISRYREYDSAVMQYLKFAGSLLGVKIVFDTPQAYVEYLKECTMLPLFYLNSNNVLNENGERVKKSLIDAITNDSKVQAIMSIAIVNLLEMNCIQEREDNYKLLSSNKEVLLDYLLGCCLPLISEKFCITPGSSFFLERMADILFNKGEQNRIAEYIVRYHEFAVKDHQELLDNPEILQSFTLLANYWSNHIVPDIDAYLNEFREHNKPPEGKHEFTQSENNIGLILSGDLSGQLFITDL